MLQITFTKRNAVLDLQFGEYVNGQISIRAFQDGEPYITITCALPCSLDDGEVAIKNYSENEGVLDDLIRDGIVDMPHRKIRSGFVEIPICTLLKRE